MRVPLVLGIDLGTTNIKVACYTLSGEIVAESIRTNRTNMPLPGWYEQLPNDWIVSVSQALQNVSCELGDKAADVEGISVSTYVTGLVILDAHGVPLAPSPTWQDQRCYQQGQRLLDEVGDQWIGTSPTLSGFPAKLLWAKEEMPKVMQDAVQVTDVKGFILRWLTGRAVTDPSSSPNQLEWWQPVFEFIDWPLDKLPDIYAATFSPGGLLADVASKVGYVAGIPVFTGTNDGAAAMIGCGAVSLGDNMTTLATNCASSVVLPDRLDPKSMLTRFLFSWPFVGGYWLGGGVTGSGAGSLQWLADLMRLPRDESAYNTLLEEAGSVPPGSNGAIFLPYLSGRGTPEADPLVRGGFVELRLDHNRGDLVRAILEGVSYALWEVYEEFSRLGIEVSMVRLTGGGARSRLWRRIIAAILDRSISYSSGDSTLGDAMIAAVGLGYFTNLNAATQSMTSLGEVSKPTPSEVEFYYHFRRRFQEVRDALPAAQAISSANADTNELLNDI